VRRFQDGDGRRWEVLAGRESWGAIVAIFIPADGGDDLRQTPLSASSYGEANSELDGLDEEDLRDLLDRSGPKSLG
jgi:hypothetical protein